MSFTYRLSMILASLAACGPGEALTTLDFDTTGTSGEEETTTTSTSTSTTTTTTITGETPTTGDDTGTTSPDEPPPPPATCVATPGDHAMAVCNGGACPIAVDVELRCDDSGFAAQGVRVAAAPEALWLATAGDTTPMLYRVTASDAAERITVPASFARHATQLATGPDGALHVASEVAVGETTDNAVVYLSEAAGFVEQTVHTQSVGAPIGGFQVAPDGTPQIFFFGTGPENYQEATPDGKGGWHLTPVTLTPGGYGNPRFGRDAQGRLLTADMREFKGLYRLGVEADGALVLLGKGLNSLSAAQHFILAPSASPTPPVGPPFAAAYESAGGLEVGWPLDGTQSDAMKIPGLKQIEGTCDDVDLPDESMACPMPCHEQGVGIEHATTSFARTPDGVGWVIAVTTQLDHDIVYEQNCQDEDGGACFCEGTITNDKSTSVLHVVRVTLDDTPPVEVLTLPMARLEVNGAYAPYGDSLIGTHAHAFADSLAIGLRLRGTAPGEVVARALRIELPTLAP